MCEFTSGYNDGDDKRRRSQLQPTAPGVCALSPRAPRGWVGVPTRIDFRLTPQNCEFPVSYFGGQAKVEKLGNYICFRPARSSDPCWSPAGGACFVRSRPKPPQQPKTGNVPFQSPQRPASLNGRILSLVDNLPFKGEHGFYCVAGPTPPGPPGPRHRDGGFVHTIQYLTPSCSGSDYLRLEGGGLAAALPAYLSIWVWFRRV